MVRKNNRGTTGIVIKNDVHARGCGVDRDGVHKKHSCRECYRAFTDTEDVFYVFANRGTQSASSAYVHPGCVFKYKRPRSGYTCRICDKRGSDMRLNLSYSRGLWVHEACLDNVPRETVPVETIPERVRKRTLARFKRSTLRYDLVIEDDGTLRLDKKSHGCTIGVHVRALDGMLRYVCVKKGGGLILFTNKRWIIPEELKMRQEEQRRARRLITDADITYALEIIRLLQKHYDKKGRPINGRLDADYNLRFLLKYGNSMEGMTNDTTKE